MSFLMAETIYLFPYSNRYVCDFSLYKKISTTCQTSWQRAFKTKTSKFQQTFTQFWHVKNSTRFHSSSSMFSIFWSSHFRYHSYPRNPPWKKSYQVFIMYEWGYSNTQIWRLTKIIFLVVGKFLFAKITFVSRIFYCSHK